MKIVYVYDDEGTSALSADGWISTLKQYFPSSSVVLIRKTNAATVEQDLSRQPPEDTILIMPGGADMPYLQALVGSPIARIRAAIYGGATYIGTCAGAYFASSACVFEAHDPELRVVGPRPLALFPLPAIGAAKPGFSYASEAGASFEPLAICLQFNDANGVVGINSNHDQPIAKVYCNGGPAWTCPTDQLYFPEGDTTVIARYSSPVLQRHGICDNFNPAAILAHKCGKGTAILSGVHPELTPHKHSKQDGTFTIMSIILYYCGLPIPSATS